jgi:GWxTD domain-containing protein
MKNKNLLFFFLFMCISTVQLGAIEADIILKSYLAGNTPYIEVYSFIVNGSLSRDSMSNKEIESLIIISSEEKVIIAEKYHFLLAADNNSDIIDLKRFQLDDGNYTVRVEIIDLIDRTKLFDFSKNIDVAYQNEKFHQSDIFLAVLAPKGDSSLVKHNVCLEPVAFNFSKNQKRLICYTELYNVNELSSEDLFASVNLYEGKMGSVGKLIKQRYKRISPNAYVPLILDLDIEDVKSNDYYISVDIGNKKKEVLSSKQAELTISNAYGDFTSVSTYNKDFDNSFVHKKTREELQYMLKAIAPQVRNDRVDILNEVISGKKLNPKRYFLYRYWTEQSSVDPEGLCEQYMKVADAVHNTYQSNLRGFGFETDRGRIFLRYGKPDDIVTVEDEPTAPPYEIWIYNFMPVTNQTAVKFLFYNPTLSTNDYELLHSTCRLEVNNPSWEVQLYGNDPNAGVGNTVDATRARDGFNRNARRFFEDF